MKRQCRHSISDINMYELYTILLQRFLPLQSNVRTTLLKSTECYISKDLRFLYLYNL